MSIHMRLHVTAVPHVKSLMTNFHLPFLNALMTHIITHPSRIAQDVKTNIPEAVIATWQLLPVISAARAPDCHGREQRVGASIERRQYEECVDSHALSTRRFIHLVYASTPYVRLTAVDAKHY